MIAAWFIFGIFVGFVFGAFTLALLTVAARKPPVPPARRGVSS